MNWPVSIVQFVVQATGIADNLAAHIATPFAGLGHATVGALNITRLNLEVRRNVLVITIHKRTIGTYLSTGMGSLCCRSATVAIRRVRIGILSLGLRRGRDVCGAVGCHYWISHHMGTECRTGATLGTQVVSQIAVPTQLSGTAHYATVGALLWR